MGASSLGNALAEFVSPENIIEAVHKVAFAGVGFACDDVATSNECDGSIDNAGPAQQNLTKLQHSQLQIVDGCQAVEFRTPAANILGHIALKSPIIEVLETRYQPRGSFA